MGVTTVLDMFTSEERLKMMKRVEREDPVDMADVRTAGIGATAPGGHPTEMGGPPIAYYRRSSRWPLMRS